MKIQLLVAIIAAAILNACATNKGHETSEAAQHNDAAKAHIKTAQGYSKQVEKELSDLEKDLEMNYMVISFL